MWMIQRGQQLRFPSEAGASVGFAGERRRKDFESYVSLQPCIARAVHLPHATFTELPFDAVWTDACPGRQRRELRFPGQQHTGLDGRPVQERAGMITEKAAGAVVCGDERSKFLFQLRVAGAGVP